MAQATELQWHTSTGPSTGLGSLGSLGDWRGQVTRDFYLDDTHGKPAKEAPEKKYIHRKIRYRGGELELERKRERERAKPF